MKIILFLPGIYGIIIYFRLRDYNAVTVPHVEQLRSHGTATTFKRETATMMTASTYDSVKSAASVRSQILGS